jgi:hypothetical protein
MRVRKANFMLLHMPKYRKLGEKESHKSPVGILILQNKIKPSKILLLFFISVMLVIFAASLLDVKFCWKNIPCYHLVCSRVQKFLNWISCKIVACHYLIAMCKSIILTNGTYTYFTILPTYTFYILCTWHVSYSSNHRGMLDQWNLCMCVCVRVRAVQRKQN